MQTLANESGVCALQLWSAVLELTSGPTPESALRGSRDEAVAAALLLETNRADEAQRLRESSALAALLERLGTERRVSIGIYRLLCVLEHEALASAGFPQRALHFPRDKLPQLI
jgi:hypothetical protein